MKNKIQMFIMLAFTFICYIMCGVVIGNYMITSEEQGHNALLSFLSGIIVYFLTYTIQVCCHETGHMIFGLLTGYKFVSIRFFNIIFVNTENGIKIRKFKMAGTGGQCIMMPPERSVEDMPVFWYNMGGCIINIILCAVASILYNVLTVSSPLANIFLLSFILMGLTIGIGNALPLSELGVDGANAVLLMKNVNARKAFINSLIITRTLSEGKSVNELPDSFFEFDRSIPLDNILVTSQAVTYFNKLFCDGRFDEALETGKYIIENAKSIHKLHESTVLAEMVFIHIIHFRNFAYADKLYKKYSKKIKNSASLISGQRFFYAYYKLCVRDSKKAEKSLKNFETIAKNYPYKYDLDIERGFIKAVDDIAENESD